MMTAHSLNFLQDQKDLSHQMQQALPNRSAPEPKSRTGSHLLSRETGTPSFKDLRRRTMRSLSALRFLTHPHPFLKTCELACSKATGRCFRAAAQLLTAPTAPPTSISTFNITKLLFPTETLSDNDSHEWNQALARIKHLPLATLPTITTKAVTHRLMRIRAGAQPGCSRSRNSHLAHVLLAPWGAQAMH